VCCITAAGRKNTNTSRTGGHPKLLRSTRLFFPACRSWWAAVSLSSAERIPRERAALRKLVSHPNSVLRISRFRRRPHDEPIPRSATPLARAPIRTFGDDPMDIRAPLTEKTIVFSHIKWQCGTATVSSSLPRRGKLDLARASPYIGLRSASTAPRNEALGRFAPPGPQANCSDPRACLPVPVLARRGLVQAPWPGPRNGGAGNFLKRTKSARRPPRR